MAQQQTGKLSQSTTSDQLSMTATDSLSVLLLAGMPDADPDAENSGSDAQNYRVIDAGVRDRPPQCAILPPVRQTLW